MRFLDVLYKKDDIASLSTLLDSMNVFANALSSVFFSDEGNGCLSIFCRKTFMWNGCEGNTAHSLVVIFCNYSSHKIALERLV
jgi:hypothetical protein